jgi:hypothetical protein
MGTSKGLPCGYFAHRPVIQISVLTITLRPIGRDDLVAAWQDIDDSDWPALALRSTRTALPGRDGSLLPCALRRQWPE